MDGVKVFMESRLAIFFRVIPYWGIDKSPSIIYPPCYKGVTHFSRWTVFWFHEQTSQALYRNDFAHLTVKFGSKSFCPLQQLTGNVLSTIILFKRMRDTQPWTDLVINKSNRGFHKCTTLAIVAILPFMCSYTFEVSFSILILLCLVNTKFDITGYKKITFQGWILQWCSKFEMSQRKHKWQYWHSWIAESLWKPWLLKNFTSKRHVVVCTS